MLPHHTLGYKAIYPDEAIQAHLAFLARRREPTGTRSSVPDSTTRRLRHTVARRARCGG
jgi:hypothetical protein